MTNMHNLAQYDKMVSPPGNNFRDFSECYKLAVKELISLKGFFLHPVSMNCYAAVRPHFAGALCVHRDVPM